MSWSSSFVSLAVSLNYVFFYLTTKEFCYCTLVQDLYVCFKDCTLGNMHNDFAASFYNLYGVLVNYGVINGTMQSEQEKSPDRK